MGLVCCRPSQPPTSQTSTLIAASPLTSSHSTPTPTPYVVQRPSSQVTSQKTAKCPECHQLTSTLYWGWCQHCSARHFSANFTNWSSGNLNLDKLIQEIQLNATYSEQVIEWIPYEQFQNIRYISKGGFGEVMYAEWVDGQIYNWDIQKGAWKRRGKHPVALKKLKGSEECPENFLNEVKSFHSITLQELSFEVTRCFGISQDPTTKEYIMVTSYAENGSLHHYLQQHPNIDWSIRVCFLLKIVQGLHVIHSAGLIHRNFHSGNILVGKRYPTVSDFGLNGYIGKNVGNTGGTVSPEDSPDVLNDDDNGSIFGVIPYIDPEVLKGNAYTPSSDVYSFGMIMYELLTGHRPFHDIAHDFELITWITSTSTANVSSPTIPTSALNSTTTLVFTPALYAGGNPNDSSISLLNSNRPRLRDVQHPKCWIQLMRRCWNDDPAQRPTTVEIKEVLEKWYQLIETNVAKNREDLDILRDFRDAEGVIIQENRNSTSELSVNSRKSVNNISLVEAREKHPEAYYYSRKIPTMKLVKKLEEKMKLEEVRDHVNLRYLQIEPSNNSSRDNLGKSSSTATQTINNQLLNPYRRWSSTWNNVMEDRGDGKSDTEMDDTDNKSNFSKGNNSRGGVVGGVVEILRNSFEIEEMNDGSGSVGDANDTTPISIFWKANSEDKILEDDKKKFTNDLSLNDGLEGDHRPKNDGSVPVNDNDNKVLENGNPTKGDSGATSKLSQNHTSISYFRENTRKNSLTQSYKTLIHDHSQRDGSGPDNDNTMNYNNNYMNYFKKKVNYMRNSSDYISDNDQSIQNSEFL